MDFSQREHRYAATYPQNEEILGWLRKEEPESVLEPDLAIVDPHHHLWDRRRDACKYRTIVYQVTEILEDMYYPSPPPPTPHPCCEVLPAATQTAVRGVSMGSGRPTGKGGGNGPVGG